MSGAAVGSVVERRVVPENAVRPGVVDARTNARRVLRTRQVRHQLTPIAITNETPLTPSFQA